MSLLAASSTIHSTALYSDKVEHLNQEVLDLLDLNRAYKRELQELRKERIAWRETQRQANTLESANARLNEDVDSLRGECNRLRRKNEDLKRNIDDNAVEVHTMKMQWLEREEQLVAVARADREKLRGYIALQSSNGFEDDEMSSISNAENITLKESIKEKETIITKQSEEIRELKLLLEAIVAHANQCGGFERQPFNYKQFVEILRELASQASSSNTNTTINTPAVSDDGKDSCSDEEACDPRDMYNESHDQSFSSDTTLHLQHRPPLSPPQSPVLSPSASFEEEDSSYSEDEANLFDDMMVLDNPNGESLSFMMNSAGEHAPDFDKMDSRLQSRLAAYGLRTDGNRKARKKRLDRFKMNKKKEALEGRVNGQKSSERFLPYNVDR
ncbi:hypothetical protein HDU97_000203 [Phlyctochytrium planicorne]|nr:hypothetical protein HDU97_000203 [Phlyctochytrium planicorne]